MLLPVTGCVLILAVICVGIFTTFTVISIVISCPELTIVIYVSAFG